MRPSLTGLDPRTSGKYSVARERPRRSVDTKRSKAIFSNCCDRVRHCVHVELAHGACKLRGVRNRVLGNKFRAIEATLTQHFH